MERHKIFVICPVREATEEEIRFLAEYAAPGHERFDFYWPHRDTDQNDPNGYRICSDNREALLSADAAHLYWTTKSQGTKFDIGMAFGSEKPLFLINGAEETPKKSFQNVLLELDRMYRHIRPELAPPDWR